MRDALARRCLLPRRLCILAGVALAFSLSASEVAQPWEFQETVLRARLDNPTRNSLWQAGDINGNGLIDEGEHLGQIVSLAEVVDPEASPDAKAAAMILSDDADQEADDAEDYRSRDPLRFEALHRFNSSANPRTPGTSEVAQGAQLSRSLRFASHDSLLGGPLDEEFRIDAGVRFVEFLSKFTAEARFATGNYFRLEQEMSSQSLGPHLGLSWSAHHGRLRAAASSVGAIGYRRASFTQEAGSGVAHTPGNPTSSALYTFRSSATHEGGFSPLTEASARLNYDLTTRLTTFVGCNAAYQWDVYTAYPALGATSAGSDGGGLLTNFEFFSLVAGFEWAR